MTALTATHRPVPSFRLRSRLAGLRGLAVLMLSILIAATFALDVAGGVRMSQPPARQVSSLT